MTMTVPRIAMIMGLGVWAACLDTSPGNVTSVNVPVSQLAIEPTIVDAEAVPTDGKVPVEIQFFQGNNYVKLGSGTVTVNGVAVPYGTMGYTARVPIVAPGGTLMFTVVQSGKTTQFPYEVPPRPTIKMPAANELVLRSANLMISYVAATGHAVRPLAADAAAATSGIEQSDNGTAFIDVSGLGPGPGSVGLTRRYVTTPSNTGFQNAVVTYSITSVPSPVTWQ